jgi:hypothetical protein
MSFVKQRKKNAIQANFLPEFQPFSSLWEGPDPVYPSEYSARWAMRKMKQPLAEAKAVALHRNRIFVHPQRFAKVAEQTAISNYEVRAASEGNE